MAKAVLPPELESYISENPEFVAIMKTFGETMETYQEALRAMGMNQSVQIISGTTSTTEELDVKSASTRYLKISAR